MKETRITLTMALSQVMTDCAEHPMEIHEEEDVEITTSVRAVRVDDHPDRFNLEESINLNGVVRLLRPGDVIETKHLEGSEYVLTTFVKRGHS